MARHRHPAFPKHVGFRGAIYLYDPAELSTWELKRRGTAVLKLLGAVIGVGLIGYSAALLHRSVAASWALVRLWRWLSGEAHHGKPITDAGWFRHGHRALTRPVTPPAGGTGRGGSAR